MINLLPNERKEAIQAARANTILLRYTGIITLAFIFVVGSLFVSHTILESTMKSAEELIASNDVKADIYKETKQQVDELSLRLNDAKVIADQEVLYSQVLIQIGQLVPTGAVLESLKLDTANFSGAPVEISVFAQSTVEATQLQSNFQNSPLFTQVSLNSTESDKGIDNYPVHVSLTATLNRSRM